MVEVAFKGLTPEGKAKLRGWAEPLDARNKQRVLAAFERLGLEERVPEAVPKVEPPKSLTNGEGALTSFLRKLSAPCGAEEERLWRYTI